MSVLTEINLTTSHKLIVRGRRGTTSSVFPSASLCLEEPRDTDTSGCTVKCKFTEILAFIPGGFVLLLKETKDYAIPESLRIHGTTSIGKWQAGTIAKIWSGNYWEYLRKTDHDDSGVGGFLSLPPTDMHRTFAADPPLPTPPFLATMAGDNMKGTREIAG